MNTINMTIQLCEEDRRRLDVISDTMELIRLALTNGPSPAAAPANPEVDFAPEEETPGQMSFEQPEPEIKDEPVVPWVTMADIQKKVVDLSTAGKKNAVKAIIQEYAPKVSAISEDKYAEVLEKLAKLEG